MKKISWILILLACNPRIPVKEGTLPPSHDTWNSLLNQHVNTQGLVDYPGFNRDSLLLTEYVEDLLTAPPNESHWGVNDRLAYWINLYNAATVLLVTRNFPVKSIKDIGPSWQLPRINTPWQISWLQINDHQYSLDDLEHSIIRENFEEPRIHFALVCAALSCPSLRNEAYTGEQLEEQLSSQTRTFLRDSKKNLITENTASLSKIFLWYRMDFEKRQTLTSFLNKYSDIKIHDDVSIDFLEYNWALNQQNQKH